MVRETILTTESRVKFVKMLSIQVLVEDVTLILGKKLKDLKTFKKCSFTLNLTSSNKLMLKYPVITIKAFLYAKLL